MSKDLPANPKLNSKNMLKTGFRRSMGLLILFVTVTLSSCTELFSPLLDFLK